MFLIAMNNIAKKARVFVYSNHFCLLITEARGAFSQIVMLQGVPLLKAQTFLSHTLAYFARA